MAISTTHQHSIDSRHGYAMLLMIAGSVAISFGGLVQRNIEFADPWQVTFYRALGIFIVMAMFVATRYRGRIFTTVSVKWHVSIY